MEYLPASPVEVDSDNFMPESLTVLEAARRAGVTQSAIIRWIRNGYLAATPSADGWQIPAAKLAQAQAAADAARGTGPVPRQTGPRLVPAPADLRRSLAIQAHDEPARLDVMGEALISPLVELIRDQTDVVHDQAEVIGWLQAERSRLNSELAALKGQEQAADADPAPESAAQSPAASDANVDEVVGWLWNDSGHPFETATREARPTAETDSPHPVASSQPGEHMVFETPAAELEACDNARADAVQAAPSNAGNPTGEPIHEPWFVVRNDAVMEAVRDSKFTYAPRLKPISLRSNADIRGDGMLNGQRVSGVDLSQMIDETERKIAQMWHAEAELRSSRQAVHGESYDVDGLESERASFWQRHWPLKRKSS